MINLQILPNFEGLINSERLVRTAQFMLETFAESDGDELSVVIDDDLTIQNLNRDYLGIDAPTDVLSFPANEPDPETGKLYLGDVIISLPRAQSQSQKAGHSLEAEVHLLAIHGVLHLLGYDHDTQENKVEMWEKQAHALAQLGIEINQLPED